MLSWARSSIVLRAPRLRSFSVNRLAGGGSVPISALTAAMLFRIAWRNFSSDEGVSFAAADASFFSSDDGVKPPPGVSFAAASDASFFSFWVKPPPGSGVMSSFAASDASFCDGVKPPPGAAFLLDLIRGPLSPPSFSRRAIAKPLKLNMRTSTGSLPGTW